MMSWSIEERKQRETITQFEWNAFYGAGGEKQEAAKGKTTSVRVNTSTEENVVSRWLFLLVFLLYALFLLLFVC